jgi:hypothetical protein
MSTQPEPLCTQSDSVLLTGSGLAGRPLPLGGTTDGNLGERRAAGGGSKLEGSTPGHSDYRTATCGWLSPLRLLSLGFEGRGDAYNKKQLNQGQKVLRRGHQSAISNLAWRVTRVTVPRVSRRHSRVIIAVALERATGGRRAIRDACERATSGESSSSEIQHECTTINHRRCTPPYLSRAPDHPYCCRFPGSRGEEGDPQLIRQSRHRVSSPTGDPQLIPDRPEGGLPHWCDRANQARLHHSHRPTPRARSRLSVPASLGKTKCRRRVLVAMLGCGSAVSLGLGQIYPSERVNIPSAEYPF